MTRKYNAREKRQRRRAKTVRRRTAIKEKIASSAGKK